MIVLPLAITACLLIWVSITVGEQAMVTISAVVLFIFGLLTTVFLRHRFKSHSARKFTFFMALVCLVTFVSVPITNWPLRVAFKYSRPSFERIAKSLQAGETFDKPIRVGLFSIKRAEVYKLNGKICFWTDLDPAGKTGFTKCPITYVPFNLWSMIELDKDWQFVSED